MPATLNSPKSVSATVDTVRIGSHAVNHDLGDGALTYHEGYVDQSGAFTPVTKDQSVYISAPDIQGIIARTNELLSGMATPDVYAAEKRAFYEHLLAVLGVSATIV